MHWAELLLAVGEAPITAVQTWVERRRLRRLERERAERLGSRRDLARRLANDDELTRILTRLRDQQ